MMAKGNCLTRKVLSSSIHNTRGWTHQEVMLSNCCLHFFDKQLTYVCGQEWAQDWNTKHGSKNPMTALTHTEPTKLSARMLWKMNPLTVTPGSNRDI
jgi:hypothetical protein